MLREHIGKENTTLFPMTKLMLSAEEYEQLRKGIVGSTA